MATFLKHKSGIFYIVYCDHGRRTWKSLGTRDRRSGCYRCIEAERMGLRQETSTTPEQTEASAKTLNLTVQQAIDEDLQYVRANFSVNTYRAHKSIMKLILEFFGAHRPVAEIFSRDIERYKCAKADEKPSPHTVNDELRCMRAFFRLMVEWGLIHKSPCQEVKPIRIDDVIRPYLSREELGILLAATKSITLHEIIASGVLTGLRLGEIINLKWEDSSLEKRKIIVRSNGTFHTKSGRIRLIPMSLELYKILEATKDQSGLLFKGKGGKPPREDFVSKQFKKAVRRCNLNPKLHFHSLRHTFGSYLVERGVSLYHVHPLTGHSSPSVT